MVWNISVGKNYSEILQFLGGHLYTKFNENMFILCFFVFNDLNILDNFMTLS